MRVVTPKMQEWKSKVTRVADFEYASQEEEKPHAQ
jgi:hypothetical protein